MLLLPRRASCLQEGESQLAELAALMHDVADHKYRWGGGRDMRGDSACLVRRSVQCLEQLEGWIGHALVEAGEGGRGAGGEWI